MADVITKPEVNESPFSFLEDEDTKPTNQPPNTDGDAGDKPADDGSGNITLSKKDYKELMDKLSKVTSTPSLDNDKLEKVMENNKIVEAMKAAILPNEGEMKATERRKLEEAFDANPIDFMKQIVRDEISGVEARQTQSEVRAFANEVVAKIDKEYAVDWDKDGKKIASELALMDPGYKQKDPKGATIKAMKLAGVGTKRATPVNFPYFEPSNYSSADQMKKAKETEAEAYKKTIFEAAKKIGKSPLDGFLGK